MQRATILPALLVGLGLGSIWAGVAAPAYAADLISGRYTARMATAAMLRAEGSPFPQGKRAQSIWASDACWSGCQSYCTWGEAACLTVDAQGRCLQYTDRCDRVCQSTCRPTGGPLPGFVE